MAITAEYVRSILDYDPETGVFRWKVPRAGGRMKPGYVAGSPQGANGYWQIYIDGKPHKSHRLAWLHVTGSWPVEAIDHINGLKGDNRWANLREVTRQQNSYNIGRRKDNASGVRGVSWHKRSARWVAYISMPNKQRVHLGQFASKEEAIALRMSVELEVFGEYRRVL